MIPPRLAHQLQSLVTRKLLESPIFNEFVARTDGAFHSMRLALKEGWQEGNQESSNNNQKSSHDDQQDPKPHKTTHESKPSPSGRRKTFHSTDEPSEPRMSTEQDNRRLDTEQKLRELLEKLRRQQLKS